MSDATLERLEEPLRTPQGAAVTAVTHWTDHLFSFRVERPQSFRFRSGEFVMIGLPGEDGRPLLRAYSIASPCWEDELEFFSIKVPDGPLTSRLQNIAPGDRIILKTKPTGTLILDALSPARRLYLFSTGTGIAPFTSLIRDPETYDRFDEIILTHTCRTVRELAYGEKVVAEFRADPLLGSEVSEQLSHYTTVTQEDYARPGRITDLIASGKLFADLGRPPLDPATDRVMICGSMGLNNDLRALIEAAGFTEGANNRPAEYVLEKAFVG
ncbi:MAG: ferredoxin--NADP reductase [Rhodovibrionaceae bacterium]